MDEIEELIDAELLKEREGDRERVIGEYYFSELSYCLRQTFWKYTTPKPTPTDTLRVFKRGEILENWFFETIRKNENVERFEGQKTLIFPDFTHNLIVRGRLDGMFLLKDKNILIELKSVDANPENMTEAKTHHLAQLNPYLLIKPNLSGQVTYIGAGNLKTKSFIHKFNKEMFLRSMDRVRQLNRHLTKNELPEAEAYNNANMIWQCSAKYCPFFEECMKIEREKGGNKNEKNTENS